MNKGRKCTQCEKLETDADCKSLVAWIGIVVAEECHIFEPLEEAVVEELTLEAWR